MSDSGDVDPTISESEWYDRIDQESDVDTESTDWETQDDASSNSEVSANDANSATSQESSQDSESEQIREGALEIFDQYFAAEGSTFQEGYTDTSCLRLRNLQMEAGLRVMRRCKTLMHMNTVQALL